MWSPGTGMPGCRWTARSTTEAVSLFTKPPAWAASVSTGMPASTSASNGDDPIVTVVAGGLRACIDAGTQAVLAAWHPVGPPVGRADARLHGLQQRFGLAAAEGLRLCECTCQEPRRPRHPARGAAPAGRPGNRSHRCRRVRRCAAAPGCRRWKRAESFCDVLGSCPAGLGWSCLRWAGRQHCTHRRTRSPRRQLMPPSIPITCPLM